MKYQNCVSAIFLDRPNRFIAHVELNGKTETVHVKNTGRCRELLLPGARVTLQDQEGPNRKTKYDLISVYKENLGWVNIDSQVPNKVVAEWLQTQDYDLIKSEFSYGHSRVDFYMEKDAEQYLMEVKGCTLEVDGQGYFPDAPSVRAARHCRELAEASRRGYHCFIAFVIAMEQVTAVSPNRVTDPDFAAALEEAENAGVRILELPCSVTADSICIRS